MVAAMLVVVLAEFMVIKVGRMEFGSRSCKRYRWYFTSYMEVVNVLCTFRFAGKEFHVFGILLRCACCVILNLNLVIWKSSFDPVFLHASCIFSNAVSFTYIMRLVPRTVTARKNVIDILYREQNWPKNKVLRDSRNDITWWGDMTSNFDLLGSMLQLTLNLPKGRSSNFSSLQCL